MDSHPSIATMVSINRISTRSGDGGTTGLADGSRRSKHDALIHAIGEVDEANSVIGLCLTPPLPQGLADELRRVQNDLFDLGADLANPRTGGQRISSKQVERLETVVASATAALSPLRSFILPGGTQAAAWLHLARTVVRRAERAAVAARAEGAAVGPEALRYLNRLSDCCFAWARLANDGGLADVLWVPGANAGADPTSAP